MKFLKQPLLIIVLFNLIVLKAFSQDLPKIEILNQIYSYDTVTKELKELPLEKAFIKAKSKAMGWGGQQTELKINNLSSNLKANINTIFLIKRSTSEGSLNTFQLYKARIKNDYRIALFESYGMFGPTEKSSKSEKLDFKIKEVSSGVYQIIVPANLEKGEYMFINLVPDMGESNYKSFTFSFM